MKVNLEAGPFSLTSYGVISLLETRPLLREESNKCLSVSLHCHPPTQEIYVKDHSPKLKGLSFKITRPEPGPQSFFSPGSLSQTEELDNP
jgi:hypothetical protein